MPLLSPDTTQLNQVAIRIAAGLASAMALFAVLLHQDLLPWLPTAGQNTSTVRKEVAKPHATAEVGTVSSVAIQPRIAFCAQHVTPERSFVIFRNGTCVIVNEPSKDPIAEAKDILTKTSGSEARFITRKIEDGHLMVTYREPVFHCLFAPEIEDLSHSITQNFSKYLSLNEKKSMPASWTPPTEAKFGLYSRKLLNLDASDMTVAKVVRSRPLIPEKESREARHESWPSSRPAPLHVIADSSKLTP